MEQNLLHGNHVSTVGRQQRQTYNIIRLQNICGCIKIIKIQMYHFVQKREKKTE